MEDVLLALLNRWNNVTSSVHRLRDNGVRCHGHHTMPSQFSKLISSARRCLHVFVSGLCFVTPAASLSFLITFDLPSTMAFRLACTSLWRAICAHLFEPPTPVDSTDSSSSGSSVPRSSHFSVTPSGQVLCSWSPRGFLATPWTLVDFGGATC